MTIQEDDNRKLQALLAIVPITLPHYCDDVKTQRRVGKTISAIKQPLDFRMHTVWI
jgi:hypothetical protein